MTLLPPRTFSKPHLQDDEELLHFGNPRPGYLRRRPNATKVTSMWTSSNKRVPNSSITTSKWIGRSTLGDERDQPHASQSPTTTLSSFLRIRLALVSWVLIKNPISFPTRTYLSVVFFQLSPASILCAANIPRSVRYRSFFYLNHLPLLVARARSANPGAKPWL